MVHSRASRIGTGHQSLITCSRTGLPEFKNSDDLPAEPGSDMTSELVAEGFPASAMAHPLRDSNKMTEKQGVDIMLQN